MQFTVREILHREAFQIMRSVKTNRCFCYTSDSTALSEMLFPMLRKGYEKSTLVALKNVAQMYACLIDQELPKFSPLHCCITSTATKPVTACPPPVVPSR